mmetsp:Transcript_24473/g.41907  ORF Transcript_24473/g.41907 Transcript_24473/m.41907 type:complete len:407 (-) Transcript_24473:114-1334(-)|eukprot:CAMPEP_0183725602 /NCGR_PEP_ID=MMETSP0737-20130205/20917_1 /TAXON_ID=385413 /ORGANISM="Thalassiosira miniscula, Strain CCMP1093" /LENGTH=406 /DNA_ID=CAMNT_0025956643 /DNA_START=193 /DNA_END=1413 /DNA_ORIENTATION=-
MTFQTAKTAVTVLSLLSLGSAFHAPCNHHVVTPSLHHGNNNRISSLQLSMSTESEVEKLRAAAAKAREEYERLSKEMGKEVTAGGTMTATADAPVVKNLSADEVKAISKTINFEAGDATSQIQALDGFVDSGDFSLWKSAVRRGPTSTSSSMSKLVPFPVSLANLESRTDGKVTGPSLGIGGEGDVSFNDFKDLTVVVVLGSTALGILSLAVLPENIGATFTYLFALIPVGFIGIGSVAPGIIAGAITSARGEKEGDDVQRERICRHEAGHFLCGYMCGLPVKNYEISSDTGVACVEFHTSGNAGQELSDDAIAALSVVAMSGSVAEIMNYGKATGGENDLLELQNCFRKSKEFIGAAKQQDLTRWGALMSYGLIKENMSKYESLVQAFKDNKSLTDCVAIIEGTA